MINITVTNDRTDLEKRNSRYWRKVQYENENKNKHNVIDKVITIKLRKNIAESITEARYLIID